MKYHEGEDAPFAKALLFEGSTACIANAHASENPYEEGTIEYKWWKLGFVRTWLCGWVAESNGPRETPSIQ